MLQKQSKKSSFRESIKAIEADIHHANNMVAALPKDMGCRVAALPKDMGGDCVQMKLSYSPITPLLMYLVEWMNWSCLDALVNCMGLLDVLVYKAYVDGMPVVSSEERKASLREFYAVIYPMLKQLDDNLISLMEDNLKGTKLAHVEMNGKKAFIDDELEEECGICMELDTKVALPHCGHSMCYSCFHDWYVRSRSCPFCRGSLKRVASADLWVLTSNSDVVDTMTLAEDNLRRFYLYIENLPPAVVDDSILMYHYLM